MVDKDPIVFKCEASLWDMMVPVNPDGRSVKPFDMRRWDLADERIYRLSWGHRDKASDGSEEPRLTLREALTLGLSGIEKQLELRGQKWVPDEKAVSFLNKATGELLTFEYLGVEFADWAPGWGFLLLGKRLAPPVEN
jgi:hypothetical protein